MITPIRAIEIVVTGSTGTVTPTYDPLANYIKITTASPVTLSSNFALNLVNFEAVGEIMIPVYFDGDVTLSGFLFNLATIGVKQSKLKGRAVFFLFYDGTAWSLIAETDDNQLPDVISGENVLTAATSGTITLTPGVDRNLQRLTGSVTLVGNYTIALGSGNANDWFYIQVPATITTAGNTLNIGTRVIDSGTALAGDYAVFAYCAGGTNWYAQVINGGVPASKVQPITALSVLGNATNASASPAPIVYANDGDIVMRDGTGLAAKKIEEKNFSAGLAVVKQAKVSIGSAQLLDSFSTPIQILAAAGAGKSNVILSIVADCSFGTVAYATNTNARIFQTGSTNDIAQQASLLAFSSSQLRVIHFLTGNVPAQYVKNAATFFSTQTGNPTAGDGTITLIITYITID